MLQKHRVRFFPKFWRISLAISFGCHTLFQNVVPSVSYSIRDTKRNRRKLNPVSRENWK
jgi:hypothetical protein